MTYHLEQFFMCLFVMWISSLVRSPLRCSAHFLIHLLAFLLLTLRSSFDILGNNPSSDVSFASFFSQSEAYLLILMTLFFLRAHVSNFNEVQLTNLFFYGLCFWCYMKKASPYPTFPRFSTMSFSRIL